MGFFDRFKKQTALATTTAIDMSGDVVPLDRQMMEELAVYSVHRGLFGMKHIYNPDDVVGRFGLKKYDEMYRRDDMVRNATNMKLQARLGTGWDINPPDPEIEPRGEEMAACIKYSIEHMHGEFTEAMRQIYSCTWNGYSVTEINLAEPYTRGPFKGKVGLKSLKTKNPSFMCFELDEFGNIKTEREHGVNGLVQGRTRYGSVTVSTGHVRNLPPEKFIIMSYNGLYSNIYGESDYRACFRNYRIKDAVMKFWSIALERYGMPTIFLKILQDSQMGEGKTKEPNGLSTATKQRARMIVKNLQAGTSAFGPGNMELERIEEMKGKATYNEAIQYHDRAIARAILMPALTTEEGSKSGSLAMAKTHFLAFGLVVAHLGRIMEEALDEQLIRRFIDWNYPDAEAYPIFKFRPMNDERLDAYMARAKDAIELGILDANEPQIREQLEYPPREDPKQLPAKAEPKALPPAKGKAPADDLPENNGDILPSTGFSSEIQLDTRTTREYMLGSVVPYLAAETTTADWPRHESLRSYVEQLEDLTENWESWLAFQNGERSKPATSQTADKRDLSVKPSQYDRPLSFIEKRVDLQGIQQDWQKLTDITVLRLTEIMQEVKDITMLRARKLLTGKMTPSEQARGVAKFVLAPKQMNEFRKAMMDFYNVDFATGVDQAATEVEKGVGKKLDFTEGLRAGKEPIRVAMFADLMTPEDALEFMKNKSPVLRRMLLQYDRRAFTVTGVERERILSDVKRVLQTGIARGHSVPDIMGQVGATFDKYLITGEIVDGALVTANRLETIVRTNLSEAFNSGRLGAFREPEIAQFLQAYEYTAIIDPRTTDFCEGYDQFTRPTTDPIWGQIWPPNHFNCRSMVVAAVTGDPWERTNKLPGLEPQTGFKL